MRYFFCVSVFVNSAFLGVGSAYGVARQDSGLESYELSMSSEATQRARTDVQIRRIKHMMTHRQTTTDAAFERLRKIQNNLSGKK